MAKIEHISLYNLELEKTMLDMAKFMELPDNKPLANNRYCLFYPMIGKEYNEKKDLIVYGQFATDWKPAFKLTKDKKQIETLVKKAYEYSVVSRGCPLDWVNKYWIKQNLYRSFFWNITYKLVMERYGRTEKDWNHIITYSNLMKISPIPVDVFPNELIQGQLFNAAHLFKEELSILQPRNVLLITGLQNWAEPVLRAAGIKFTTEKGEFVEATTAYRGSHIIVAKKPFTADHRKFLDEIKRNMV
ncbi:MAG: hypothetical protein KDC07_08065 [Chitinophagaceae bacterium]|nr:hypothetical protein [Chitinophagaceae bacterium]MCB9046102.1 hypothetical protein [Chitinophagales bacterium]